ncbi:MULTISPECIES: hypothetical protein [Kitasatospora]|uniref:Septum formation-related domain-containing protein n=1 Tax=Kitasatospora cathayae TaxID=3004092 RepID=A0ABY7Q9C3_9ACTN|nr:hypothetical protein [Kitasatospora sp. HUAS 3-15]WBP89342.1 hypothetical protein O1G21_28180 [Kitasatospora sp. HUAS 3-15]
MTSEQQPPEAAASRPPRGLVITVVAVLAVLLAVVATVLLWPEDTPKPAAAPPPPSPSSSSATPPPTPTPTPTKPQPPYAYFPVGTCFDHPQLSPVITKAEERPCTTPHDGEVIANLKLPDNLTGEIPIALAMRDGCKDPEATAKAHQPDGKSYYPRQFGPALTNYQQGWRDYTCTLTAGPKPGSPKLTRQLHQ